MCFSSVYGFWSLLWYLLPVNFYNKCSVTKLRTCKITAYIGYYVFLQFMALDRPFVTFSLYILIRFNFQNCVLFRFYFILVIGLSFSFNFRLYIATLVLGSNFPYILWLSIAPLVRNSHTFWLWIFSYKRTYSLDWSFSWVILFSFSLWLLIAPLIHYPRTFWLYVFIFKIVYFLDLILSW